MSRIYLRFALASALTVLVFAVNALQTGTTGGFSESVRQKIESTASDALDVCVEPIDAFMPGMFK